jgi:hypothetical protein
VCKILDFNEISSFKFSSSKIKHINFVLQKAKILNLH